WLKLCGEFAGATILRADSDASAESPSSSRQAIWRMRIFFGDSLGGSEMPSMRGADAAGRVSHGLAQWSPSLLSQHFCTPPAERIRTLVVSPDSGTGPLFKSS